MKKENPIYSKDDLCYALECAAEFLDCEEWPENDGGKQQAAYKEAAKIIRKISKSIYRKPD